MDIIVHIIDAEENDQIIYEGTVAAGSEVITQDVTTANADFDKDGTRKIDKDGNPATIDVVSGVDVFITAPKPKEKK
jgi:ribosomal protein L18E